MGTSVRLRGGIVGPVIVYVLLHYISDIARLVVRSMATPFAAMSSLMLKMMMATKSYSIIASLRK